MKMNCNHSLHYVGTPEGDVRRGWLDHSMHEEVPGYLLTTPRVTWIWTMRRTDYILAAKTKVIASQLALCPVLWSTFLDTMIQQKEKQRSGHHCQVMITYYTTMQLQPRCRRRAATRSQRGRDGWLLCLTETRLLLQDLHKDRVVRRAGHIWRSQNRRSLRKEGNTRGSSRKREEVNYKTMYTYGHIWDDVALTDEAINNRTLNTRPISAHLRIVHLQTGGDKMPAIHKGRSLASHNSYEEKITSWQHEKTRWNQL
jgi:hypothetical protein